MKNFEKTSKIGTTFTQIFRGKIYSYRIRSDSEDVYRYRRYDTKRMKRKKKENIEKIKNREF